MPERTRTPPAVPAIAPEEVLAQLELPRALEEVAARAAGPLGAASVRARRPTADADAIRADLADVSAMRDLLAAGDPFRPAPVADIEPLLDDLRLPGTVLDGESLLALGGTLEAIRATRAELDRIAKSAPRVAAYAVDVPFGAVGRDLLRTFDADGRVRDGADAGVDRARRRVRDARDRLVQTLERVLRSLAAHQAAPDGAVTVRGGRYVIPVQADARGRVPGIVHAESASGATLFVEPQAAVDLGNQLARAEADEQRAEHAVLRDWCDRLRPHTGAIADGAAMCVRVDDLYARARYAADVGGSTPRVVEAGSAHVIRGARHPLLLAKGVDTVPFDLALDPEEQALIVSGPNTGGKTVLLKAVGLTSALVQSGIVPPLGPRSELPVYDTLVTDIGDHQSIAANLSTFSAHLVALRRALDAAGPGTLVLVDEIGSGTDPAEGAALAAAVLRALVHRRSRTIATTHLGALKELAADTPGVVNASLEFDGATLTPTYILVKGIPGRSYGLVIARRLGIPPEIIEAADARRPEAERSLETLLADVERRATELAERESGAARRERAVEAREAAAAERRAELDTRAAELERRAVEVERDARDQARRFLLDARKRVEDAVRAARTAGAETEVREARRLVEREIRDQGRELERLAAWAAGAGQGATPVAPPTPPPSRRTTGKGGTDLAPRTDVAEVDLRGMLAEDAREAAQRAVDDAVLADLPVVRIIHGKGTGALRRVVHDVLAADRRVRGHRLAPPREGGTGVTIAELAG